MALRTPSGKLAALGLAAAAMAAALTGCSDYPSEDPLRCGTIWEVQVTERTATSVRVTWETDRSSFTRIRYRPVETDGVQELFEVLDAETFHDVVLDDLRPNTLYEFEVASDRGTELIETQQLGECLREVIGRFRTLPVHGVEAEAPDPVPDPAGPVLPSAGIER